MAYMHDDDRRARRYRDDDDRERMRGTAGYDPYDNRRRGPGGRWTEEYGGRRSSHYGAPERDDEDGWQRDRERSASDDDDRYRYGRGAMRTGPGRSGPGWYGTPDYERYALGGRYGGRYYGSESMGGTVSMAGKGPKGYKRSDERIREDVCDCLTDDPELDASAIEVKVKDGEVTLSGGVDSRHAKRHAEHLIDRVSGVKDVHNGLNVQEGGGRRSGRAAGPS